MFPIKYYCTACRYDGHNECPSTFEVESEAWCMVHIIGPLETMDSRLSRLWSF